MANLYMLLIGCLPKGRNIEQHDIFFGVGETVKDVLPDAIRFWPEAGNSFHVDAWRKVSSVDGYSITVSNSKLEATAEKLFFINLGGYKQNEFEEFHYRMLAIAPDKASAVKQSKQTAFFKHTGFKGAPSHIDEKYGIDVDDITLVQDILPAAVRGKYHINISPAPKGLEADTINLGYFRPDRVAQWSD